MQEDVMGTRRTIMPSMIFVVCVRCGKETPRNQAKIVPASTLTDANSEFEYICLECQQDLADGETELIIEP